MRRGLLRTKYFAQAPPFGMPNVLKTNSWTVPQRAWDELT